MICLEQGAGLDGLMRSLIALLFYDPKEPHSLFHSGIRGWQTETPAPFMKRKSQSMGEKC